MADRVITAEALITAKDGTGDVFSKIAAKFHQLGKGAKVSAEIEKMTASLERHKQQLSALDKFQATRGGFKEANARFMAQKVAVEQAARALKSAEKPTKELEAAYKKAQVEVSRSAAAFEKQKGAIISAKRAAEQFGSPLSKIASEQAKLRTSIESTTRAIEKQAAAEHKAAYAAATMGKAQAHAARKSHGGFDTGVAHGFGHATGATALIGGYGVVRGVERVGETYREFDKERRYGKAVMGITDEEQAPLIEQAIQGGAKSKYNDIQWLEAQRELAARGLTRDQVMAITGVSATLGQAMDKSLPEASRMLEGGMFGFGKDMSTLEKARANAARTADLQVKSAKISGMNAEDVQQAYKYGAAPFRMAGLSEEQLLAFAAVGKKSNMNGDEMGVAARALSANLMKPTAGARTAMLANGIDFSKFQKLGARAMDVDPFSQSIAATYGVELNKRAKSRLQSIFNDKTIVADAAKFMPAVMKVLGDSLGKQDAKSKKSIAGEARRYRDAAMSGVDSQALLDAMIPAIRKNPALANLLFGSKQGSRIRAALGDNVYEEKLDQLKNHAGGFAQNVSDARMAGFDGALSRFENAVKNIETAVGRAVDGGGKGGMLTDVTSGAAKLIQSLAEAPPQLQRLGVEAAAVATAFAGIKGLETLMGGFGLKESAVGLSTAASELQVAATRLGAGGALNAAEGAAGAAGGLKGKALGAAGRIVKSLPLIGTAAIAFGEGISLLGDYRNANPSLFRSGLGRGYRPPAGPALPTMALQGYHPELPAGHWDQPGGRNRGYARRWVDETPHPAMAPISTRASSLPVFGGGLGGPTGKIEAVVEKPVDVTGKVTAEVKGQATVSVTVKVDGPGAVTSQTASSSGNIKVSTGASMPTAKAATGGTPAAH